MAQNFLQEMPRGPAAGGARPAVQLGLYNSSVENASLPLTLPRRHRKLRNIERPEAAGLPVQRGVWNAQSGVRRFMRTRSSPAGTGPVRSSSIAQPSRLLQNTKGVAREQPCSAMTWVSKERSLSPRRTWLPG